MCPRIARKVHTSWLEVNGSVQCQTTKTTTKTTATTSSTQDADGYGDHQKYARQRHSYTRRSRASCRTHTHTPDQYSASCLRHVRDGHAVLVLRPSILRQEAIRQPSEHAPAENSGGSVKPGEASRQEVSLPDRSKDTPYARSHKM